MDMGIFSFSFSRNISKHCLVIYWSDLLVSFWRVSQVWWSRPAYQVNFLFPHTNLQLFFTIKMHVQSQLLTSKYHFTTSASKTVFFSNINQIYCQTLTKRTHQKLRIPTDTKPKYLQLDSVHFCLWWLSIQFMQTLLS